MYRRRRELRALRKLEGDEDTDGGQVFAKPYVQVDTMEQADFTRILRAVS
jgi:hypothetical protein